MNLCNLGTTIHPARFLFNAGKTPTAWNDKMLHNEHYKVVKYWSNPEEVFENVDIKGGVAAFTVIFALYFCLKPIFCHLCIKNFAKIICNTENFCNFGLGNHSEILSFIVFIHYKDLTSLKGTPKKSLIVNLQRVIFHRTLVN